MAKSKPVWRPPSPKIGPVKPIAEPRRTEGPGKPVAEPKRPKQQQ